MKRFFPTWSLALLIGIGVMDLIITATLYQMGLINEMNPVMRLLLNHSTTLFVLGKGLTLCIAWWALWRYHPIDKNFVHRASLVGSAAYASIWFVWFVTGVS